MADITITAVADGATVSFRKDAALIASFKAVFPRARWKPEGRVWHVLGVQAAQRLTKWAAEVEADALARRKAEEEERRSAEFDGIPDGLAYFDALKAEGRRMSTIHVKVRIAGEEIRVTCPYDDRAVRALKDAGGRWDDAGKAWVYPIRVARKLHPVVDLVEAMVAPAAELAIRRRAEQDAERARERAEQDARATRRRANRYPFVVVSAPGVGSVIRLHGRAVVVESHGKVWRMAGDAQGAYPPHLWNRDVRYVYFRDATSEEAAILESPKAESPAPTTTRYMVPDRAELDDELAACRERWKTRHRRADFDPSRPIRVVDSIGGALARDHGLGVERFRDNLYGPLWDGTHLTVEEACTLRDLLRGAPVDPSRNFDDYGRDRRLYDVARQIAEVTGVVTIEGCAVSVAPVDGHALQLAPGDALIGTRRLSDEGLVLRTLEILTSDGHVRIASATVRDHDYSARAHLVLSPTPPSDDQVRVVATDWLDRPHATGSRRLLGEGPGATLCGWALWPMTPDEVSRRYGDGRKVWLA